MNFSKTPWLPAVLGLAGIALLAVILIALAGPANPTSATPVTFYRATDASRPKLALAQTTFDLGNMKVQEDKSVDVPVKNTGDRPLQIFRVFTSCMCTFAQIIAGAVKSPEFNMEMHESAADQRWSLALAPGETAQVRATYRPSLMPVQGPVQRVVSFSTNDPERPTVDIILNAVVE